MLKYACGNEVMVGDTVLRFDSNGGFLAVGEYVVKDIRHYNYDITLDVEGESLNFSPDFFNLISRKGETTMKTKQFTKADLKTGMRLVFSQGATGIVLKDVACGSEGYHADIIKYIEGFNGFDYLNNNLDTCSVFGAVQKILRPKQAADVLSPTAEVIVVWEREAPKSEEQIAYDEAVEAAEAARKAYELAQKKLEALNPANK